MSDKFLCPRRVELPSQARLPEHDEWRRDKDWAQTQLGTLNPRRCSHCGSLEPKFVMEGFERGIYEAGPTDKSYKVYVADDKGDMIGKFYFQHFDLHQRQRFVELINEKRLRIGYPGHFYVLPFFTRAVNDRERTDT